MEDRRVRAEKEEGIEPVREFESRLSILREVRPEKEVGIVPMR
jgi:hypothetical protein